MTRFNGTVLLGGAGTRLYPTIRAAKLSQDVDLTDLLRAVRNSTAKKRQNEAQSAAK